VHTINGSLPRFIHTREYNRSRSASFNQNFARFSRLHFALGKRISKNANAHEWHAAPF